LHQVGRQRRQRVDAVLSPSPLNRNRVALDMAKGGKPSRTALVRNANEAGVSGSSTPMRGIFLGC
jgi:hypothetical protein